MSVQILFPQDNDEQLSFVSIRGRMSMSLTFTHHLRCLLVALFVVTALLCFSYFSFEDDAAHDDVIPTHTLEDENVRLQAELATVRSSFVESTGQPIIATSSSVTRWTSTDGLIKHYSFERSQPNTRPSDTVLISAISCDETSWGRNPAEAQRSIYSYLDFITNNTLEPSQISVAILTSSPTEFERYIQILTPDTTLGSQHRWPNATYYDYDFQRVYLVLHTANTRNSLPSTSNTDTSRDARHNIPQHERRANLAKLRNYLQSVALRHESHVLWLDSDVYKFSSDTMISQMLSRTRSTSEAEVGILTSRCRRGEPELADAWLAQHPDFSIPEILDSDDDNSRAVKENLRGKEGGEYEIIAHKTQQMGHYDLNAWAGRRTGPNNIEQEQLWKDIASWTPHNAASGQTVILDGVIEGTRDDEIKRLDSVGGTILMIRADLIRMGLVFPTGYLIGMTYEHGEGFDGIETEGLCVLSTTMSRDGRSMCFAMGGDWSAWHTVF